MLQGFWFGVIAILWTGYYVLEGFDFGVGMLLPLVGRTERERGLALRTIGPVWDGNEVWLLVAGGAMFAAFPEWYASVFSGFYLAFALLLIGLILRGIGIEYRGKAETARGRRWCEGAVVIGSFLPALLLGVAFADFIRGVDLSRAHVVTSGFFSLLSPYALLGGVVTLTLFALHGAAFLTLRSDGPVAVSSERLSRRLLVVAVVSLLGWLVWTSLIRGGFVSALVAGVMMCLLLVLISGVLSGLPRRAFVASSLVVGLLPVLAFCALWPDVLPARNNDALSLTVHNANSSHYTLVVMTVVALIFTPIVLAYQAWSYWVFRARVGAPVPVSAPDGLVGHVKQAAADFASPDGPAEPRIFPPTTVTEQDAAKVEHRTDRQ